MLRVSRGVSAARRVASDGASRAREGVGRAGDHLRRARDVVGSIPVRQVCLIARGALFENPGLRWNVRAPPAIEIRLGAPRGLGWFKVNEGRWRDARGPGDAPEVHREATPRRAPSRDHPASAFEVRSLGVVVARARDVDVSAAAEVIRAAAATPARLAREAGEYIANARDVQKRLFERAEEAVRRAEEVVGRKSEFIKGIPNTYYDEESPPRTRGLFRGSRRVHAPRRGLVAVRAGRGGGGQTRIDGGGGETRIEARAADATRASANHAVASFASRGGG